MLRKRMAAIQFRNFHLVFQRISSDVSFLRPLRHKIENFDSYVEKLQSKENCGTGAYRGAESGDIKSHIILSGMGSLV
jgi:hypothetical protein